jgi:hypothetical protein
MNNFSNRNTQVCIGGTFFATSEIQRYLHYNFVCLNNSALNSRIIPRKEWFLGLKIKKTNEVCL